MQPVRAASQSGFEGIQSRTIRPGRSTDPVSYRVGLGWFAASQEVSSTFRFPEQVGSCSVWNNAEGSYMTAISLGRPVRVALIGCGLQGTNHSQTLKGLGSELVEVAALCDSSLQRLSEASSTWPGARTAEDYRQTLDSGDFDLVIVATMPNTHAEIAIAAMERGASVLCEKPFTLSVQEAEGVLEAASRTGRQVQLGTNMRYMPESRYLRNIVASGDVGSVVACKTWGCHFSPPLWGPHYRRRLAGGGGTRFNSCARSGSFHVGGRESRFR